MLHSYKKKQSNNALVEISAAVIEFFTLSFPLVYVVLWELKRENYILY